MYELFQEVGNGNSAAIERLYHLLRPGMLISLRMRMKRDIEDALQESYHSLLNAIAEGRIQDPGCLGSYLRTILVRTASKFRTQDAKLIGMEINDENLIVDNFGTPEQIYLNKELQSRMYQVMDSLNVLDREILERYYLKGESIHCVSQQLGMSKRVVEVRKSRAKQKLVGAMKKADAQYLIRRIALRCAASA